MTNGAAYPEYKETGLKWLGQVPASWGVVPLWTLYSRGKSTDFPEEVLLSVYRDHGVVPKSSRGDNFNKPSEDLSAYQLVKPGDMVINKMKAWQGSVAISRYRGIVSPAYFVYERHHGMDDRYLHYLLRSERYITGYLSLSKGIRINQWDLDPTYHSRMPVLVPSLQEQRAIVDLLDRETAQIDDLIGKQERLIELLAEKRQAIITHAVTKGLDATVPTKPSGQPYLGEIPGHWTVRPFRLAAEYQEGPGIMAEDFLEEGVPLLRISGVKDRYASLLGCKYLDPVKTATRWRHFRLRLGDVLISASASMGTVSEVGPETVGSIAYTGIICLRPRAGATKEFLKLLVVSDPFLRQIELHKTGSTMQHYGPSHLSQMRFAFPPTFEQHQIVAHVNEACCKIDKLLEKAHASIDLLKERRSALISAAVTGKIDVQEGAA